MKNYNLIQVLKNNEIIYQFYLYDTPENIQSRVNEIISNESAEVTILENNQFYKILRKEAYPPLEDFADAYVHNSLGDSHFLQDYLTKCALVKTTYPKPE